MLRYTLNRLLMMIPTLIGVGGARLLHAARDPRRHRRGEAARRRRHRLAGSDRLRAQAARPRQAAGPSSSATTCTALATFDLGMSMWTERPVTEEISLPAGTVAAGRDHGDDLRGAARDTAWDDRRAHARHLGGLCRAHRHHRRAVDPVVLVRHADHDGAALLLELAAADHLHADLCRPGRQSHPADLAGDGGRLPLLRGGRAHDPLLAARSAATRTTSAPRAPRACSRRW